MTTRRREGGSRGRRTGSVATVVALTLAGCSPAGPLGPTPGAPTTVPPTHHAAARGTHRTAPPTVRTGTFHGDRIQIPVGHGAPISFTFDDGPSPRYTPEVLALLARHHVPAVFCLIGRQARAYPALVRREARAGHLLCDHSRDHDLDMSAKGKAYVAAEVDDGLAEIRGAAPGAAVPFYRQPGGYWNRTVVRAMTGDGLLPLRWNDDPRDWSRPGSTTIVRRVVKDLRPGAIILMHDGGGDRSESVAALTWLLGALPAAGWRLVPAPQRHLSAKAAAKPQ